MLNRRKLNLLFYVCVIHFHIQCYLLCVMYIIMPHVCYIRSIINGQNCSVLMRLDW